MNKLIVVSALALNLHAQAAALKGVTVDNAGNIRVVTAAGKVLSIANNGKASEPQLSPDGESAAWLYRGEPPEEGESTWGSSELRIYRNGKTRTIKCLPFIREFWYWKKGSRIAIDCGGKHFAGHEILYDAKSLKQLDSFDQGDVPVEKRPEWSNSSDRYKSD
ncbi:MAG: hypothetical protein V4476_02230 [Pseudomonadota bacterium]